MLQIIIPATEQWDEARQEFIYTKRQSLQLEHSLVSLHRWETKWCKPFLSKQEKTVEETLDYVRCMTLTQNVDPELYRYLTNENMEEINSYIEAPMTATWFRDEKKAKAGREQITAEMIYYWMIVFQIPPEYRKWHLNQLLTLIKVCNIKSQPSKKLSKKEVMSRNAALNASRRQQANTKG